MTLDLIHLVAAVAIVARSAHYLNCSRPGKHGTFRFCSGLLGVSALASGVEPFFMPATVTPAQTMLMLCLGSFVWVGRGFRSKRRDG